jgi:hypothetical protein
MPAQFTRADCLREYLTGALSDGGVQTVPDLSLGGYRSSTEAVSLGITISNPLTGVSILYAGGGNPVGVGTLTAVDANHLSWAPFGASSPGLPASFNGTSDTEIVEGLISGQYLRISGTTPFTPGNSQITLAYIRNNLFGFDDVSIAQALSGVSQFRASLVRNEGYGGVTGWQRWLTTLGPTSRPDVTQLPSSGSGTLSTSGLLADFSSWPTSGWCRIENSGNTLREIVYYSSRTNTVLTIPSTGRGLFLTTPSAGSSTDFIYPVPGVAIGIDSAGAQSFGSSIQTIANQTTAPSGITWNVEITPANGLQLGSLPMDEQIGIWIWRQIPANAVATPASLVQFNNNFSAF